MIKGDYNIDRVRKESEVWQKFCSSFNIEVIHRDFFFILRVLQEPDRKLLTSIDSSMDESVKSIRLFGLLSKRELRKYLSSCKDGITFKDKVFSWQNLLANKREYIKLFRYQLEEYEESLLPKGEEIDDMARLMMDDSISIPLQRYVDLFTDLEDIITDFYQAPDEIEKVQELKKHLSLICKDEDESENEQRLASLAKVTLEESRMYQGYLRFAYIAYLAYNSKQRTDHDISNFDLWLEWFCSAIGVNTKYKQKHLKELPEDIRKNIRKRVPFTYVDTLKY